MKTKHLYLALCAVIALSSCSKVYTPALYHQDIAYMPKPASFDSTSTQVYVSVGGGIRSDAYYQDEMYTGQANLSVGHRFDNVNIAYGGFAELGNYKNSNGDVSSPNYFKNLSFGAVGGRFSANLFKKIDNADFRYIGIEAAYSHEFGDFAAFKKGFIPDNHYYLDQRVNLFTIGLTTEIIFHPEGNINLHHGIRGFVGFTPGHNQLNSTINKDDEFPARVFREVFPKFSYFINYKHYFGVADVGSGIMMRFGYRF